MMMMHQIVVAVRCSSASLFMNSSFSKESYQPCQNQKQQKDDAQRMMKQKHSVQNQLNARRGEQATLATVSM